MPQSEPTNERFLLLKGRAPDAVLEFHFVPSSEEQTMLIDRLDLLSLKKARLVGRLLPQADKDWRLEATLGATAGQPCVVTLAPVTTRVDSPVVRMFVADAEPEPIATESEIPEDDTVEPLPEKIDLLELFSEVLALALPDFPRAADAELEQSTFSAPGIAPLQDEDAKPFAALKALKDSKDDGEAT